jgi:hypothetical protein
MNICSGFSSHSVDQFSDLPAYQKITISFSDAARLSAEDAFPPVANACPVNNPRPYNFMVPGMQMYGSITRWVE